MAHLTGFGLENFRVFEKETWFDFAPITIFTGTNSSGKSSVNKALLLLSESYKVNRNFVELDFQTDKHKLNIIENTFSKSINNEEVTFVEQYKLFNSKEITLDLDSSINSSEIRIGDSDILPFVETIELKKSFSKKQNSVKLFKVQVSITQDHEKSEVLSFNFDTGKIDISILPILNVFNSNLVEICKEAILFQNESSEISFENLLDYFSNNNKKNDFLKKYNSLFLNKNLVKFNDNVGLLSSNVNNYEAGRIIEYFTNQIIKEQSDSFSFLGNQGDGPSIYFLQSLLKFYKLSEAVDYYFKELIQGDITFNLDFINALHEKFSEVFSDDLELIEDCKSKPVSALLNKNIGEIFDNLIMPEIKLFEKLLCFEVPITFIEAVRANTQRVYTFQSQGTSINSLLSDIWKKGLSERKEKFLSKWVKEFGIADRVEINNIKNTANEIQLVRGDERIDLADVGYGFTQLLPLILKAVFEADFKDAEWCRLNNYSSDQINPTNKRIIIIEEPEVNLHPALQSKIADFIVDFSRNFDATVIIETHSEYLIRRLQFLTAKKEIKPEDTIIHYLFHPESDHTKSTGEQLRTIRIKEDGRLDKEFGTGFFDESVKLIEGIWNLSTMN